MDISVSNSQSIKPFLSELKELMSKHQVEIAIDSSYENERCITFEKADDYIEIESYAYIQLDNKSMTDLLANI